jgi:hypothetical protein
MVLARLLGVVTQYASGPLASDRDLGKRAEGETILSESERKIEGSNGDARHSDDSPALRAISRSADQIRKADQEIIDRVRERPLVAVAVALAAGYIIGRVFSRWG